MYNKAGCEIGDSLGLQSCCTITNHQGMEGAFPFEDEVCLRSWDEQERKGG